jgi:hypothetical protein
MTYAGKRNMRRRESARQDDGAKKKAQGLLFDIVRDIAPRGSPASGCRPRPR